MKIDKMQDIMRFYEISKPFRGSGVGGKIVAADYEDAIGDYFFAKKYGNNLQCEDAIHMHLRRNFRPMKAYRFNELTKDIQDNVLEDGNGWIGEKKYDGWRIIITHIPGQRLHFFGGNLSTTEFLPVDYTYHLPEQIIQHPAPLVIDAEAVCYDVVIQQDGFPSTNTREAIVAILGCSPDLALEHQKTAKIHFKCFDEMTTVDRTLSQRKQSLAKVSFQGTSLSVVKYYKDDKRRALQRIWKAGHEGMILKNLSADYDSGGRKRTHCIKIKKTASSLIGDTIDAFISGYTLTEVHSYNDLIGGIELSVYIDEKPHVIATVTNMPDHMRYALTEIKKGLPVMVKDAYGKVLEIDGQEISSRNRKLMHATVLSWDFRKDKTEYECTMENADVGGAF